LKWRKDPNSYTLTEDVLDLLVSLMNV